MARSSFISHSVLSQTLQRMPADEVSPRQHEEKEEEEVLEGAPEGGTGDEAGVEVAADLGLQGRPGSPAAVHEAAEALMLLACSTP